MLLQSCNTVPAKFKEIHIENMRPYSDTFLNLNKKNLTIKL